MDRLVSIFERLYSKFPYLGDLIFLDTETTGLEGNARVIEIGAIRVSFDGFDVKFDTFETLINPGGVPVSEGARKANQITDEELQNAEEDITAFAKFVEWLKETEASRCIAHNAAFDEGKLKYNLVRLGYDSVLPPFECTWKLSKQFLTKPKNDKLGTLSEYFNFINTQAHRALADTEVCAYVYAKIKLGEYE